MPPDPVIVTLAPGRAVSIAWTQRARYRLDELQPRPVLSDVRNGTGFAFLAKHLWACLAEERDRRRYRTAEDLAAACSEDESILTELWRAMWQVAFDFDPDAPADEAETPPAGAVSSGPVATPGAEPTAAEKKNAGLPLSPSPASN